MYLPTKNRRTANENFTNVYYDLTNMHDVYYTICNDTVSKQHVI